MRGFNWASSLFGPGRRRALKQVFLSLALIVPASAMMRLSNGADRAIQETPPSAEHQATAIHAVQAVESAVRQQYIDRDRAARAARYAVRFRIEPLLADDIYWAAIRERIDPQMAFRLVSLESSFRTGAVSPKGAVGLTQLLPSTAKWLVPETRVEDLFDSRYNLRVGFRYLRKLIDAYDDPRLALLAYNRGPATVDALVEAGIDPSNGYAHFVLTGDRTPLLEYLQRRREAPAAERHGT